MKTLFDILKEANDIQELRQLKAYQTEFRLYVGNGAAVQLALWDGNEK